MPLAARGIRSETNPQSELRNPQWLDQDAGQLDAVFDLELAVDLGELALDCPVGLAEAFADLAVVAALGHEEGDAALVGRETLEQGEGGRLGGEGDVVDAAIEEEEHAVDGGASKGS